MDEMYKLESQLETLALKVSALLTDDLVFHNTEVYVAIAEARRAVYAAKYATRNAIANSPDFQGVRALVGEAGQAKTPKRKPGRPRKGGQRSSA